MYKLTFKGMHARACTCMHVHILHACYRVGDWGTFALSGMFRIREVIRSIAGLSFQLQGLAGYCYQLQAGKSQSLPGKSAGPWSV